MCLHKAAHLLSPKCRHLLCSSLLDATDGLHLSLPASQRGANTYRLATTASISESQLPLRPNQPSEKDDLSLSNRILISNDGTNWLLLIPANGIIQWAKMPTLQPGQQDVSGLFSPLYSAPLWCTRSQRCGHVGVFPVAEGGWWSAGGGWAEAE